MNFEQIEGHLAKFEDRMVAVSLPIRGNTVITYYGNLNITHQWSTAAIYYGIKLHPDSELTFQASDVATIINDPNPEIEASIILKHEDDRFKSLSV